MSWAEKVLDDLKNIYEITIVSSGYSPNLTAKELWINKHLPYCNFIGVNLKEYKDKSHINMQDGIFIDDSMQNLVTSNAILNICFGDDYEWNKNWQGIRCRNWMDVGNCLTKLKLENPYKTRVLRDEKTNERLNSYGIEKGDKMKFNFIDCIEFEIDWKAVAAIAVCVLGYAIITVI